MDRPEARPACAPYVHQGFEAPTIPDYYIYNPAWAQVRSEHPYHRLRHRRRRHDARAAADRPSAARNLREIRDQGLRLHGRLFKPPRSSRRRVLPEQSRSSASGAATCNHGIFRALASSFRTRWCFRLRDLSDRLRRLDGRKPSLYSTLLDDPVYWMTVVNTALYLGIAINLKLFWP